jgi:bifunctional enzyme CysN/CysC
MDLVEYSQDLFTRTEADYLQFASRIGLADVQCIPVSAVHGHNIVERAASMPWYDGPTLIEHLESVSVSHDVADKPFRLPVQIVSRPNADFRGFAGLIVAGVMRTSDGARVLPSGRTTHIKSIFAGDQEVDAAQAGQSVTVVLSDDIDVSRGDVIVAADAPPPVADQFEATIVWMHERPMLQGRSYHMRIGPQTVLATIAPLKYKVNVDTLEHVAAKTLELNDIGVCGLALSRPIVFEPYAENRDLGGFVLVDRVTNATVGAGLLPALRAPTVTERPLAGARYRQARAL